LDEACRAPLAVIRNEKNLGFGAANNQAFRQATGTFFALLNDDAVPASDWLHHLLAALKANPQAGMAAGKALMASDQRRLDNTGHLLAPDGLNRGRGRGQFDLGQFDRASRAFFPSGCAALYRREMIEQIGGFDEDFFAYGDDTDLGLHGRLLGWDCLFVPQARVIHYFSQTAGAYSPEKAYLVERNRLFILLKYFPRETLPGALAYTFKRHLLQALTILDGRGAAGAGAREHGKTAILSAAAHVYRDAWKALPVLLRKRKALHRVRTIDDEQLLRLLAENFLSAEEAAFNP
jgi:GT2 family glycosyltransferase